MDNKLSKLIELVQKLPEAGLDKAIESITEIIDSYKNEERASCPRCNSTSVVRYGIKDGKQRYRCNGCGRIYTSVTGTALSQSHYGEAVWRQVIRDTVDGTSIDQTAQSLELSHQTAFNMRHKILLAIEADAQMSPTVLGGVCEIDDTFVLESQKGTPIPDGFWRDARLHGAKAQKRGVSDEYVNICAGVDREGNAYSVSMSRATPSSDDISGAFSGHIDKSSLVMCDGAKSYGVLTGVCGCELSNVNIADNTDGKDVDASFYNINSVNGFHSFIKGRYVGYRGVATKYLNRYVALFSKIYGKCEDIVDKIYAILTNPNGKYYHSTGDVKSKNLLNV
jgi:transposase-like protein